MNTEELERANAINSSISEINLLLNMSLKDELTCLGLSILNLSMEDKEFETKFKQLLNETKQRLQKEFDEL
jgi:hypothetical protein